MAAKECPMCSEMMQLRARETVERVPGTGEAKAVRFQEWVCPECDYFEEFEEEG
jgi:C4-type Zn-finger protein